MRIQLRKEWGKGWGRRAAGQELRFWCRAGDGIEGEVERSGGILFAPLLEEAAVAQGNVLLRGDAQARGYAVNPFGGAFELGVVANRGFVDDAVTLSIVPLGAPFFVAEGLNKAERVEDFGKYSAVGDFGFSFDAVFVAILAWTVGRHAFVSDGPSSGVAADAEDLNAGAQLAVGRVVEDVALKAARGMELETGGFKALRKTGQVSHFEFDLGLDGHRKREYTAEGWLRVRVSSDNRRVKTLRLTLNAESLESPEADRVLEQAAEILRRGGLVALPTETVYGLGANALDAAAVARIFEAKQRPAWDPVIVHVADEAMLRGLVADVPEPARKLMKAFWPGPLTLLLPRTSTVPDAVTAGRPLVGVRMPAHPVALALIRRAGVPVAAPSANRFGHISPTTVKHVLHDLDGRIDAVVDAGPTAHGVESTVLDPCQSPMVIYRPGAVTVEQIRAIGGEAEIYRSDRALVEEPIAALPSPGVGLRHYAPKARLVLVEGPLENLHGLMADAAKGLTGERLGIMLPEEVAVPVKGAAVFAWGRWSAPEELARNLYAGLRELDANGCTVIVCPVPDAAGIGEAVRDRLAKAGNDKAGTRD